MTELEKSIDRRLKKVAAKLKHCAGIPLVLPLAVAARELGCSPRSLVAMARSGRLSLGWSSGKPVVSRSELDRLKRERR